MSRHPVEIRILAPGDGAVLDRVAEGVFDQAIQPDLAARCLAVPGNIFAVAVRDASVVGMAIATVLDRPDKPRALYIDEVSVAAEDRRQGIAGRLVSALLERGRAMGCTGAWLVTEEDNEEARGLYRSMRAEEATTLAVVYSWHLG